MSSVWGVSFVIGGLGIAAAPGISQQVHVASAEHTMPVAAGAMTRPVTVTITHVSLRVALNTIAMASGVRIQFRADLVDALAKRVSLEAASLPLRDALDRVLAGTGMYAVPLAEDIVVVRPGKLQGTLQEMQQGTIVGKVVHAKTRQPVPGARVLLGDGAVSATTAGDGTFRLTAGMGEHVIQVRAVGFARQVKRVMVDGNQTVTVEVMLDPSASVLDEVIVTGTIVATERREIPTPITVITAADIEKRGITRVEQLFRGEVPGLLAIDRGAANYAETNQGRVLNTSRIYSRGSSSLAGEANPIKTFVDGVELLDPAYLAAIDPASIERIEIVTGPQAATIYGSGAIGGVMQVFTKKGMGRQRPDVRLNLKYGMLQSNVQSGRAPLHNDLLQVTGGSGPVFSYSGTLSYGYSGAWQPGLFSRSYGASLGATHTAGPLVASAMALLTSTSNGTYASDIGVGCGFGEGSDVSSECFGTVFGAGLQSSGALRPVSAPPTQRVSFSKSQILSLNVDYRLGNAWQHHVTLGKNQTGFSSRAEQPKWARPADTLYRTRLSNGERMSASYNTTLAIRQSQLSATMTTGFSGSWSDQGGGFQGCVVSASSTAVQACFGDSYLFSVNRTNDQGSWGGFGNWRLGMWDRMFLSLGLRAEVNNTYGKSHRIDWVPTYGATYTLEVGELTVKFLGSYGRATRPPAEGMRDARYNTDPNSIPSYYMGIAPSPNLTPEYSRGPQGGIELYYRDLGSLTVNHYQQRVSGLIQQVPVDSILLAYPNDGFEFYFPVYQHLNVANMRQQGWEATGIVNVGPVSIKGSYSWNDSRVTKLLEPSFYAEGATFRYLPTHTGNVVAGYALGGTSITVVTNWIGPSLQYTVRTLSWLLNNDSNLRIPIYTGRRGGASNAVSRFSGYTKVDIAAARRLFPWASATLNILNVGDNYTSDFGPLFPTLGRQVTLGISLRYP